MKKILLVLVVCVGVIGATFAQTLSNKERREINYQVLKLVEQYESLLALNNEDVRSEFIYLFDKQDVKIYNDILGHPDNSMKIGLRAYIEYLTKQKSVSYKIKNLSKINMVYMHDGWHTIVSFQKSLNYVDGNGILFSSQEYYGVDHEIMMNIRYDSKDKCCYIYSIDGKIKSSRERLPEKFIVLNTDSEEVYQRWFKQPLSYNSFGQAIVEPWDEKEVNEIDVHVKNEVIAKTNRYEHLKLGYKTTRGRIKARFAITPSQAFKVSSPVTLTKQKSMAMEATIDMGGTFKIGRTSAMGFFAGAGVSKSSLYFQKDNMVYNCLISSASLQSDKITRSYSISAGEGLSYLDIVVPVYIGFEHRLAKVVSLAWNVGVKTYFNLEANVDQYRIFGTISQNGQQTPIDQSYTSFVYPNKYSVAAPFSLASWSGFGSLGLNFNLYKQRLYVSVLAGYEYGLGMLHSSEGNLLFNEEHKNYPLIPSGAEVLDNVATRSFMDCVSYRRQGFWLETGIMFKF